MVEVNLDVDVQSLVAKLNPDNAKQVTSNVVKLASEDLVRNLMINSPVDHGLLKQWCIDSLTACVNYGTRPHFIYPTNKKMLYWEGADHPVPYVVHPGTSPTLFVENSIEETQVRMDEFFLIALQEVLG